jgi:hypothetical protein
MPSFSTRVDQYAERRAGRKRARERDMPKLGVAFQNFAQKYNFSCYTNFALYFLLEVFKNILFQIALVP